MAGIILGSVASIDGFASAPAGTSPQLPNLLSGYSFPPPWRVAGVHYGVGIPTGTSLSDPTSISGITGVSVDTTNKLIRVQKSSGTVTLDAYDYSLHGGYQLYVSGVANGGGCNVVLTNSKFKVGTNNLSPVRCEVDAGPLSMSYNELDGSGLNGGSPISTALVSCGPSLTFKYNYLHHAPYDGINTQGSPQILLDVRYNLLYSNSYKPDAHFDGIQTIGGPVSNVRVLFNTHYVPAADGSGWPGANNSFIRIGDLNATDANFVEIGWNTLIGIGSTGHNLNDELTHGAFLNIMQLTTNNSPYGRIINPSVHDNYMDISGVENAVFFDESVSNNNIIGSVYGHNIDMNTGSVIPRNPA